jgi:hypothetical protein
MTFADLGLSDELLKAVTEAGYDTPTPIQAQAIPPVLMMKDIIGIAQTGTGKTASFVLPMIDILAHGRARALMPRSLILEPTRDQMSILKPQHRNGVPVIVAGVGVLPVTSLARSPQVVLAGDFGGHQILGAESLFNGKPARLISGQHVVTRVFHHTARNRDNGDDAAHGTNRSHFQVGAVHHRGIQLKLTVGVRQRTQADG